MTVSVEVLHVPDCPNLPKLLARLRAVTDLPVVTRLITTDAEAVAAGMTGSPTLLINGRDPFATPGGDRGLSCRIYRDEHGHPVDVPSPDQLRAALATQPPAWRPRPRPSDQPHRAVHRAILRAFATTGRAPTRAELDRITAGTGHDTGDVLAALHDLDAIRLAPDGRIAVAYPFATTPTRHRVRIGDRVDAYAMCAVDALGIAAMLGEDTHIRSTDPTTGESIEIITTGGRAEWEPPSAVVFVGGTAVGGPSADCCCDYLNFFTSAATADAWARAHPHIPGQILDHADAEALGARLFGPLLADG